MIIFNLFNKVTDYYYLLQNITCTLDTSLKTISIIAFYFYFAWNI